MSKKLAFKISILKFKIIALIWLLNKVKTIKAYCKNLLNRLDGVKCF